MARKPANADKITHRKVKLLRSCYVDGERHDLEKVEPKQKGGEVTFKSKTITVGVADARVLVNSRKAEYADGMDGAGNKISAAE